MPVSIDTSNAALASRYDEIPYDALPHPASHPARLATVATFFGHARSTRCALQRARSRVQRWFQPHPDGGVAAGRAFRRLRSFAARARRRTAYDHCARIDEHHPRGRDLAALAPAHGEFDFIVAHGVYSWVPPDVRDALFALAAKRLARDGILYVSFNVLPGCRVRQAAWDVLHHHVDHIENPRSRLDAARQLARLVADGGTATHESDQALRAEFRAIAQHSDSELCHDDLAVPNEPVLFHTFVQHAARHGLRYLAEADVQTMGVTGISDEAKDSCPRSILWPASSISTSSGCAAFASLCSFVAARRPTRRSAAARARNACVGER